MSIDINLAMYQFQKSDDKLATQFGMSFAAFELNEAYKNMFTFNIMKYGGVPRHILVR